jgi:hypothetical protein
MSKKYAIYKNPRANKRVSKGDKLIYLREKCEDGCTIYTFLKDGEYYDLFPFEFEWEK